MHLQDMHHHPPGRAQLLIAHMALKVLRLLMLDENALIIKLSVTIIAPGLDFLPLL